MKKHWKQCLALFIAFLLMVIPVSDGILAYAADDADTVVETQETPEEPEEEEPEAEEPEEKEPEEEEPEAEEPEEKEPEEEESEVEEPEEKEPEEKEPEEEESEVEEPKVEKPEEKEPEVRDQEAEEPEKEKSEVGELEDEKAEVPAVMDSEDSQTIGLHALAWISGKPEGTSLSVSPEKNTLTRASYQIDFSKGGGEDIPAGKIEIRIPAHIFFGRDGKTVDTPIVPLAKAPAEEGDTGFNYSIDEATGEIVIRNYRTIEASYHFVCQVGYDFIPMQVANGYKKEDIQATFQIENSQGKLTAESEKLSIEVHTETKEPTAYKNMNNKYENWQDAWGEKPADAADYFYVEWRVSTNVDCGTQPFKILFQEDPGTYGTLIGWKNENGEYTFGDKEAYEKTVFYDTGIPNYPITSSINHTHYVLVKYPRTMLETTTKITNTCTAYINGYDGDNHSKSANSTYTYVAPDIIYKGDYCRTDKGGGMDVTGGVNLLKSGRSIENYFSVNVTVQGYGMTNNGADAYTTVLEDDLLFLDEIRLIEGDYTLTSFYLTGLSEYGYSIDPENGYQPVLDSDYDAYAPVTVWIKTVAAPNEWMEYGTV